MRQAEHVRDADIAKLSGGTRVMTRSCSPSGARDTGNTSNKQLESTLGTQPSNQKRFAGRAAPSKLARTSPANPARRFICMRNFCIVAILKGSGGGSGDT